MNSRKIYLYTVQYFDGKTNEGGCKTTAYTSLEGAKEDMSKEINQFMTDLSKSENYYDNMEILKDGLRIEFCKSKDPNTDTQIFDIEEVDVIDSGNELLSSVNYVRDQVESVLDVYGVEAPNELICNLVDKVLNYDSLWEDYDTNLMECVSEDPEVQKLIKKQQTVAV